MNEKEKEQLKGFVSAWRKAKDFMLSPPGAGPTEIIIKIHDEAEQTLLDLIDSQPTEHDKQQWQLDLDYIEEAVKECVSAPRPYWLLPDRIKRIRKALGLEEG